METMIEKKENDNLISIAIIVDRVDYNLEKVFMSLETQSLSGVEIIVAYRQLIARSLASIKYLTNKYNINAKIIEVDSSSTESEIKSMCCENSNSKYITFTNEYSYFNINALRVIKNCVMKNEGTNIIFAAKRLENSGKNSIQLIDYIGFLLRKESSFLCQISNEFRFFYDTNTIGEFLSKENFNLCKESYALSTYDNHNDKTLFYDVDIVNYTDREVNNKSYLSHNLDDVLNLISKEEKKIDTKLVSCLIHKLFFSLAEEVVEIGTGNLATIAKTFEKIASDLRIDDSLLLYSFLKSNIPANKKIDYFQNINLITQNSYEKSSLAVSFSKELEMAKLIEQGFINIAFYFDLSLPYSDYLVDFINYCVNGSNLKVFNTTIFNAPQYIKSEFKSCKFLDSKSKVDLINFEKIIMITKNIEKVNSLMPNHVQKFIINDNINIDIDLLKELNISTELMTDYSYICGSSRPKIEFIESGKYLYTSVIEELNSDTIKIFNYISSLKFCKVKLYVSSNISNNINKLISDFHLEDKVDIIGTPHHFAKASSKLKFSEYLYAGTNTFSNYSFHIAKNDKIKITELVESNITTADKPFYLVTKDRPRKNITFVVLSNDVIGGIEIIIINIINIFSEMYIFNVLYHVSVRSGISVFKEVNEFKISELKIDSYNKLFENSLSIMLPLMSVLNVVNTDLRRALHMHSHKIKPMYLGEVTNLFQVNHNMTIQDNSYRNMRIAMLDKFIPLDNLVLLSEKSREIFSEYVPNMSTITLPNLITDVVNDELYYERKDFIYIGRIEKFDKNIFELINIAKLLPNSCKINVYGTGNETNNFIEAIKLNGLENKIIYHGLIDNERIPSALFQHKALILCSTAEGLPNVVMEAFNCSTPVILYNSFTTASEIITDSKNGYLIEPYNTSEFAKKMVEISEMSEQKYENFSKFINENKISAAEKSEKWRKYFELVTEPVKRSPGVSIISRDKNFTCDHKDVQVIYFENNVISENIKHDNFMFVNYGATIDDIQKIVDICTNELFHAYIFENEDKVVSSTELHKYSIFQMILKTEHFSDFHFLQFMTYNNYNSNLKQLVNFKFATCFYNHYQKDMFVSFEEKSLVSYGRIDSSKNNVINVAMWQIFELLRYGRGGIFDLSVKIQPVSLYDDEVLALYNEFASMYTQLRRKHA